MNTPKYSINQLEKHFLIKIVLKMKEMKAIIGTDVNMTVYRILKNLSYLSSYSHAGKYYTLEKLTKPNQYGLWHYADIHFSKAGSLKNTVLKLITQSEKGYTANELKIILKLQVHNTVLDLYKNQEIEREQIGNGYIYLSSDKKNAQLNFRKEQLLQETDTYKECLQLFLSGLNEKQLKIYAGLVSLGLGYGGDKTVSRRLGIDVKTIAKGREELLSKNVDFKRIRKLGAGRPSLKKTKNY